MRYEDDSHAFELVDAQQLAMHECACLRVEPRERFVHQQDPRLGHEASRERHTAAHAAGKLVRKRSFKAAQIHQLQRFPRAPSALRLRHGARFEGELDVADRGAPRQQPVILKHIADRTPVVEFFARRAADANLPAVGFEDTGNNIEERALAGAGCAEQSNDRLLADREIDFSQYLQRLARVRKAFADAAKANRKRRMLRIGARLLS